MKNKNVYEQIIESLINDDEARARELFHAEIVRQSRDIYNQLVVEEAEEEDLLQIELSKASDTKLRENCKLKAKQLLIDTDFSQISDVAKILVNKNEFDIYRDGISHL